MFQRQVRMQDGRVMCYHTAVTILHELGPQKTTVEVYSIDGPGAADGVNTSYSKALDTALTFETAEEWLQTLPDFRDMLDEVLDILTDEQAGTVPDAFPAWAAGVAYAVDRRVRHDGILYRCIQAHTSQEGWEPPNAPALWTRIGEPGDEWPEWVQPTGAQDAYSQGDKVSHNGSHWTSDTDGNVWEPGVYGWTEADGS